MPTHGILKTDGGRHKAEKLPKKTYFLVFETTTERVVFQAPKQLQSHFGELA